MREEKADLLFKDIIPGTLIEWGDVWEVVKVNGYDDLHIRRIRDNTILQTYTNTIQNLINGDCNILYNLYECFDCKDEFEGELHYLCPSCREAQ
jgi:hypothetical protein